MTKIFGIGLSRTGTRSLTEALNKLGFKIIHNPYPIEIIDDYDGATDIPVARYYKMLDEKYPNSKFILTIREIESWLGSISRQYIPEIAELHELIEMQKFMNRLNKKNSHTNLRFHYSQEIKHYFFHRDFFKARVFKKAFYKHIKDVKKYFKNRPKDLLIMNIIEGDGYELLCPFLGFESLDFAFPAIS